MGCVLTSRSAVAKCNRLHGGPLQLAGGCMGWDGANNGHRLGVALLLGARPLHMPSACLTRASIPAAKNTPIVKGAEGI